jgi:hypothetical protein
MPRDRCASYDELLTLDIPQWLENRTPRARRRSYASVHRCNTGTYVSVDKTQLEEPAMDADLRENNPCADLPQSREGANAPLALHERLLFSALIAGVGLWIRVVEVIPESRRR